MDANGDRVFGRGQKDFYRDTPEAVAQAVVTRLRLWLGEWFLDTEEGTPWQAAGLGAGRLVTVDPMIRERILETEGVVSIDAYSSSYDASARKVTIAATISTRYGQAVLNEVL
ncbi:MAG TPA: hypothetical protein VNT52_00985 [Acidimicrobiales bacterium]|nr:hypothetical protein [Acidimicrobiales bacterium]